MPGELNQIAEIVMKTFANAIETAEKILKETMHIPVIEGKFVKVDDLINKLKGNPHGFPFFIDFQLQSV